MVRVDAFAWDEVNESKVERHGLSADRVDEVLDRRVAIFRNRRGMRGAYLLVGRDFQGRHITVIIERYAVVDPNEHIWRPVTAWASKASEVANADRQGV